MTNTFLTRFPPVLRPWLFVALAAFLIHSAIAMTPPPAGKIAEYKKDGSFESRRAFAEKIGNDKINPNFLKYRLAKASGGPAPAKLPYKPGFASKGSPRLLVFTIDFPDNKATLDTSTISNRLFGTTADDKAPYQSMTNYYKRSSYNTLTLQGDVMPRYRAGHNRDYYTDKAGTLVAEVFGHFNYDVDFSKYDNDGDGQIDYFIVLWTGNDTGWASFWWSWNSSFNDPTWKIDGKTVGNYSWICENNCIIEGYPKNFDPRTVIHETGHALGLPDYYDYDNAIGPKGGLGGCDMMDNGWHDHNAFSKWLLEWATPTIVSGTGTINTVQLRPTSLYGDTVAIMPGMSSLNPFAEYYMVQSRARGSVSTSNDYALPADGTFIWHVDARLNSTSNGFLYDNSLTGHKLLKLMEADGGNNIEKNQGFSVSDLYQPNNYLSPISNPTSAKYDNTRSGVTVFNINPVTIGFPMPPAGTNRIQFLNANATTNWMCVGQALDNTNITWDVGGSSSTGIYTWFGQKTTYMNDGDAAQCTTPANSNYSSMGAWITGPGPLTFNWKVSSETNKDWLEFYIDGTRQTRISGSTNWAQLSFNILPGKHYIMWKYVKDTAGAAGSDCGWVDKVDYSFIPFAVAVDNNSTTWTQSGNMQWFGQDKDFTFGGSAARSGPIADGQNSTFKATLSGPGWVDFAWKVSSEKNGDILRLRKNGTNITSISGEADWTTKALSLDTGTNVIEWAYIKNASGKAGQDCGWIDHIRFSSYQGGSIAEGVDNHILSWTSTPGGYSRTTSPNHDGSDAVICSLPASEKAKLTTVVTGPGTLSFWYKAGTTSYNGYMTIYIDGKNVTGYLNAVWENKTVAIAEGVHTVEWRYETDSGGGDYCLIDQVVYTPSNLTIAEALDAPQISWLTYGNPNAWAPVQIENAFGMDAARSGVIAHNYNTFLEASVTGPALLSFNWKVSSQAKIGTSFAHDDLEFYLDNVQVDEINGEVGWQTKKYILPKGSHPIMWDYYKDEAISAGQDCGWVDRVRVDPLPSLNEAVDNSALTFWCSGSADWLGQPLDYFYGSSAARSGKIASGQKSIMSATVSGPARLAWYWKNSGSWSNRLELWIDKKYQIQLNSQTDWVYQTYYINPGAHNVEWRWNKTSVFNDGQDCGWVDKITVTSVPKAAAGDWMLYQ